MPKRAGGSGVGMTAMEDISYGRDWSRAAGGGVPLVSVFDTTVCDDNLGNQIIMEAVDRHLRDLFPAAFFLRLPYLDQLGEQTITYTRRSAHVLLGGTNALSSDMERYRQWGIDLEVARRMGKTTLMGVGWWQYQDDPSPYTRAVLRAALRADGLHSVRDGYTLDKLKAIGIDNVVVTGCPSLWDVTDEHCAAIPEEKAPDVLLTLTNYARHPSDAHLVEVLKRRYRTVYLWIQGPEDLEHAASLGGGFTVVDPSLAALDRLLAAPIPLDVVGTRLHAGIRAIAAGRRTLIVGTDNRAIEMARDVNLPVLPRADIARLERVVTGRLPMAVTPPREAIARWKAQFGELGSHLPAEAARSVGA